MEYSKQQNKRRTKRVDLSQYLIVTIGFQCNNNCINCMLLGVKDQLKPASFEAFQRSLLEKRKSEPFSSLILSGAEVTLMKDLVKYVEFARGLDFIENIRIQTNGRNLSDRRYCETLVKAGVNEFFVSVYGPDETTHNAMTRSKQSFAQTAQGIRNLEDLKTTVITNTVLTRLNYTRLTEIIDVFSRFRHVREMQFWNYLPAGEDDPHDLLVSNRDLRGPLLRAAKRGLEKGLYIYIQGFPQCLLGDYGELLDETRPPIIIDPLFWKNYGSKDLRQCKYQEECGAGQCRMLLQAYINKYGWDQDILHPLP